MTPEEKKGGKQLFKSLPNKTKKNLLNLYRLDLKAVRSARFIKHKRITICLAGFLLAVEAYESLKPADVEMLMHYVEELVVQEEEEQ